MTRDAISRKILVADDEESLRIILRNALTEKGYEVDTVGDGKDAMTLLKKNFYGVALLDIRMPGLGGLEILDRLHREEQPTAVIIMTAQDTMKNAIDSMKKGAFDYLAKPFDIEEVEILVAKALKAHELEVQVETLKEEVREIYTSGPRTLVGESRPIREIYKMIGKLAVRDVTVLISGESGTGKELIAKAIHYESPRAAFPFVAFNVSAIPHELLESELFGATKGSFTGAHEDRAGYFERAQGGTLFLDEIGEMPLDLQAKLLRVLQEREVQRVGASAPVPINIRVLAATNQDLEALVKEKKFREDLFYRLNVISLPVPPLRARREDIPVLARYFVTRFCEELASPVKQLSDESLKILKKYAWPGNVRELENVVKRAIVLSPGLTLLPEVIVPFLGEPLSQANVEEIALEDIVRRKLELFFSKWDGYEMTDLFDAIIHRVEKPLLELTLKKTRGNQIKAAEILGINRNTLRKKLKELSISWKTS